MPLTDPDLRRTWLFGPGADALIIDLEDFTPPARRDETRRGLASVVQSWRAAGRVIAVRIKALEADGPIDLAAAMSARPDVIAYPMAASAAQMHALHAAITHWEAVLRLLSCGDVCNA